MPEEKREVNFSEEVKIDPNASVTEEKEEDETTEDEKDTQEESSTQENQSKDDSEDDSEDNLEDNSEDKSEENSEDESDDESDDGSDDESKEESEDDTKPKPVEGETPRENALRLETQRLKKDLRRMRTQKVFEGHKSEFKDELSKEDQETLSQYDQKELSQFEKVIDVVAKKKGWVKKGDFQAQTYQQQASDSLDSWLEFHKEYLPENDKNNVLWDSFQRELSEHQKPNNPRDLKRVFDKVHREIFGISKVSDSKINAQKEKIKVASHQRANQRSQKIQQQKSSIDPSLREHLKGFSEEEKDEIVG